MCSNTEHVIELLRMSETIQVATDNFSPVDSLIYSPSDRNLRANTSNRCLLYPEKELYSAV
jgi:hypothetical protein